MSFQKSIEICFAKYATFSGKAGRSEYWWFFLFLILMGFALGIIDGILFADLTEKWGTGPVGLVWSLGTFVPSIAVGARRLHDTNRSGWWQLLYLTGIGIPIVLIFMVLPSRD
tara:strand:- start:2675 stop:3013 length:339 start_codon:yes stop_codon:yes gene_type:complete